MEAEAVRVAHETDKSVLILFVGVLIFVVGLLGTIVYHQMKAIFRGINESIDNTNASVSLLIRGFERHSTILEFRGKDIDDMKKDIVDLKKRRK